MTGTRAHPRETTGPRAWLFVLLACALLGGGCGVPLEDSPRAIEIAPVASGSDTPSPGAATIHIQLVARDRLRPVERSASDRSVETILASLAEGPTPAESSAGLGTALAPQSFSAEVRGSRGGSLFVVRVGEAFTSISGDDQLLAAAQVVWSVTQLDPEGRVRLVYEDEALEVPTDDGLTVGPVSRADFASVAPAGGGAP